MADERHIASLRPEQITEQLSETPVIYIPIGPLEWHGPHLPYGVDPYNAEHIATRTCARTGGLVWPTQFWGTERERRDEQVESLGLKGEKYIVGMDFPRHSLPSAYCPEEVFAILVREVLREVSTLGARLAVIVNGHGAINHNLTLHRLATEFNHTTNLRVYVRLAFNRANIEAGNIAHAAATETSLTMNNHPETVRLEKLPPPPEPLNYGDFGIVDSGGFMGHGSGHIGPEDDPRTRSSADKGREYAEQTTAEIATEVGDLLKGMGRQ